MLLNKPNLVFGLSNTFLFTGLVFELRNINMTILRRILREPVFSGHWHGSRGCLLNTGLTVIAIAPDALTFD